MRARRRGSFAGRRGAWAALACALLSVASPAPLAAAASPIASAAEGVKEGQTYDFSPFSLTVRAPREMRLVGLRLVNGLGEEQAIDLTPYPAADTAFEVELPVLIPHGYRLYWRLRDARGGEEGGSVGFVVRGCEDVRGQRAPPP